MKKQIREVLSKYRGNQGYTMEHAESELLNLFKNKKNNWRFVEVPDKWQELYEEKALLMEDMMHFAYVRNEGWVPNWGDDEQDKYGLSIGNNREIYSISYCVHNCFLFGIAVKSGEIAREMLVEFGKRIERIYNKQY